MTTRKIIYTATNTGKEFHKSRKNIRLRLGAVGSGKTVSSAIEIWIKAMRQAPDAQGIRRSKWGVVRNTYPELISTTLATWLTWFPEDLYGKVNRSSPITHRITTALQDGTWLELIVHFLALDSVNDVKKLKSFEFTGIYLNELQFVDFAVFEECLGRVNRYPPKSFGAPITWSGVIADTNPPSTRHWIHEFFEENRPTDVDVFRDAPAVIKVDKIPEDETPYAVSRDGTAYINNPAADYLWVQNDSNYWLKQVPSKRDETIKVDLQGNYGFVVRGKPVHEDFNERMHYSPSVLKANEFIEIGLGWDFGNTPACAIVQLTARGQFRVLAEIYSQKSSLEPFVKDEVVPFLDRNYPWWRENHISRHDPAGSDGSQADGLSCEMILRENGIKSEKAANDNSTTLRRGALDFFLSRMVDGLPAFELSNGCNFLKEGLMGGYHFAQVSNIMDGQRFHEKPVKNMYSHICEALEYIAIYYCADMKRPPKQENKILKKMSSNLNNITRLKQAAYNGRSGKNSPG